MEAYNVNMEDCIELLKVLLIGPNYVDVRWLDRRAFMVPNVYSLEQTKTRGTSQLIGDRINFTPVRNTCL